MASWQVWKNRFCAALFLGAVSTQAAFAVPVLSIQATPTTAVVGSTVAVDVLITGITDLFGYQFNLSFNPSVLQATSITEGLFLKTGGSTFFSGGSINNTTGSIANSFDTLIGFVPGVTGTGTLARINFNVTRAGSSSFTFSDAQFLDSASNNISVQLGSLTLQAVAAVPEPASLLLLCGGLAGLLVWRRHAARAHAALARQA